MITKGSGIVPDTGYLIDMTPKPIVWNFKKDSPRTDLAGQILSINHYPTDIFIPMTREYLDKRIEGLKYAGVSPDAEAGHLMRIAEYNTKTEAVEFMENFLDENLTPEKVHEWYLEACKRVKPKSYNPDAQKPYGELTEEQRFIDRFIVNKIFGLLLGGRTL